MRIELPVFRVTFRNDRRVKDGTVALPRQFANAKIVGESRPDGQPAVTRRELSSVAAGIVDGTATLCSLELTKLGSGSGPQVTFDIIGVRLQDVTAADFLAQLKKAETAAALTGTRNKSGKNAIGLALFLLGRLEKQPLEPGLYLPADSVRLEPDDSFVMKFLTSIASEGRLLQTVLVNQSQRRGPVPVRKGNA